MAGLGLYNSMHNLMLNLWNLCKLKLFLKTLSLNALYFRCCKKLVLTYNLKLLWTQITSVLCTVLPIKISN